MSEPRSARATEETPVAVTALGDADAPARPEAVLLDVAAVHSAHAEFVWKTLYRLGVRESDLEDVLQEVFLVVHRKRDTFDGSARLTTWLFAICARVVSDYRRRAYRRRERSAGGALAEFPETGPASDPEEAAAACEARARLAAILDQMDLEKRAVFVMFELEKLPSAEIAAQLDVPVGTVYSRLHAARRQFAEAVAQAAKGTGVP